MSLKKLAAVVLDVLAITGIGIFIWLRVTGVPMDTVDWVFIAFGLGFVAGVLAMVVYKPGSS